jgi:hypothetical protein
MPLELQVVLALQAKPKLLKGYLMVLGDDGADFRDEVLPLVVEYGGHGRTR